MVKGHSFHGVPHQPKNYVNAVELIAYALTPNRFDLVLRQINKNSVEKFMRSLSTRYSIYFNKKNHRTGVVFAGPYKSEEIKNGGELLSLTRTFHSTGVYSSLPDYLGQREASWVKPRVVLYYFEREE